MSALSLSNTGSGYVPPIVISPRGDGVDATFSVSNTQIGLNGEILGVNVESSGNGYSNVVINITGGFGSGAVLQVLPGPKGGHGSNPQKELGARSLMVAVSLSGTESGNLIMSIGNDFRQVALIENPLDSNTGNVLTSTAFFQPAQIFVAPGITNYQNDELVYQGDTISNATFTGVVQAFDSSNNILYATNCFYADGAVEPTVDLPIIGASSSSHRDYVSSIPPQATRYSGKVLFIQNVDPILRANNQTESIKLVINQ